MKRLLLIIAALAALGVGEGIGEWRPPDAGGAAPFGMHGNTATAETRAAISNLDEFQDTSNIRRTIWVNPYTGDDSTGNGSEDAPFRTIAKGEEQATSYTRVKLAAGTFFSPLTLALDDAIDADGETYLIGEGITWDAGASTGVVLDWEPGLLLLVIEKTTGTDPEGTTPDTITGVTSGAAITVDTVTNTIGSGAAAALLPQCADGGLCILFESSDPNEPANINCSNTNGGSADAIFRACAPTGCGASQTGASGWVGIQNISIDYCDTDNLDTQGDAKMLTLNVGGARVSNTAALNNNCFTPHEDSTMIAVNGWCFDHLIPSGANGSPIAPVGTSKMGVIGGFFQVDAAGGASSDVAILSGNDTLLIGPTFDANGETMDGFQVTPTTNSVAARFRAAYVVAANASATTAACKFRINSTVLAATIDAEFYYSSCVASGIGLLINHDATPAADALDLFARGIMVAGLSGDHFQTLAAQDLSGTVLDIQLVLHDDLTLSGDWRIGAESHDTILAAQGDVDTPSDWTFFTNSVESTSASTPDLPWQNDAATVTLADFGCHNESECYQGTDSKFNMAVPSTLYVPSFLLGREIREWEVGGTDSNLGAR